jgi:hypothetical protein
MEFENIYNTRQGLFIGSPSTTTLQNGELDMQALLDARKMRNFFKS